jgi:hypothetical protein
VFWDVDADCGGVKELRKGVEGVVNSVEQSGNLLVFVTDVTQYYALFRDGGVCVVWGVAGFGSGGVELL